MAKGQPITNVRVLTESKSQRITRNFENLQKWGETDAPELEWLLDELNKCRALLRSCLGDYGARNFTDRHNMADRIRKRLGVDESGREIQEPVK